MSNKSTGIIPEADYLSLLRQFSVGNPIAEADSQLEDEGSRIETAVFNQLLKDQVDIVRGTKGSGKTALYRIFGELLSDFMLSVYGIVVIKGTEAAGDPTFMRFSAQFQSLSELSFENFWRIYLISLVNTELIDNKRFARRLKGASKELRAYRILAARHGFPVGGSLLTPQGLITAVFARLPQVKVTARVTQEGVSGDLVLAQSADQEDTAPVFINEIHTALKTVLDKAGIKVWLMLDRLDEVFPRRSDVETTALRALLRTTRSFSTPQVRLKLFLRDDIFDDITTVRGGFPALTHIMSRSSAILSWSQSQIVSLVLSRVCSSERILGHFDINRPRLRKDDAYRREVFDKIFPPRIGPGRRLTPTIDWLYKQCEDGNGIVTPRDVIDLLSLAKSHQVDMFHQATEDMTSIISATALLHGHRQMSLNKRASFIKAEYAHLWPSVRKFEHKKAVHNAESLERILGRRWRALTDDLMSIGFLGHDTKANTYVIPHIYRQCLDIKQGREKGA